MRAVQRAALVAQPPGRMYALINDVESYPLFVPWCTFARVEARTAQEVIVTLGVKRGPLATEFTTRNVLEPESRVRMQLERGPFNLLEGTWTLVPIGELGTRVEFDLRFAFDSRFAAAVFEPVFEETATMLVDAFVGRARSMPAAGPAA
jgi:ribosome-associated toxin RatA of RatAB toxin-antitoxin module